MNYHLEHEHDQLEAPSLPSIEHSDCIVAYTPGGRGLTQAELDARPYWVAGFWLLPIAVVVLIHVTRSRWSSR